MAIETIVNGTSVIINEQPNSILYVTIAIALITLGGIIWSNLQTKKSNELLEKDIQSRIRPWISIGKFSPHQIFFKNGSIYYYNNWVKAPEQYDTEITQLTIKVELQNMGKVPAKNIRKKIIASHDLFDKKIFETVEFNDLVSYLMPNQTQDVVWYIEWDDWKNRKSTPLYLGLFVEFEIEDNIKEYCGLIGHIKWGNAEPVQWW